MTSIPAQADTVVIGGGTAGAAVAGLVAQHTRGSVVVLEAGPDYGAFAGGRWPAELLDAREIPITHQWDYDSGSTYPGRIVPFERAKVLGGCSSHNGCAAIWGHRADYDAWAADGNDGWATDDLLPSFREVDERLHVRRIDDERLTPFQQACLDATVAAHVPAVDDLNDLDQDVGVGPAPLNVADGVRWNTAFAYLDPVRDREGLTVCGDVLVDRLVIRGPHDLEVVVNSAAGETTIATGRVVLAAGAYGSPAILLRSGVGEPHELRRLGIQPIHELPGVGANLHDHPAVVLSYTGSDRLERAMHEFGTRMPVPDEQVIAKLRSDGGDDPFDLHMYPVSSRDAAGTWTWTLPVACMVPRSRGSVRLASPDPSAPPVLDHRYLSDPGGHDRAILWGGVQLVRSIAHRPPLADLLTNEVDPGPALAGPEDLDDHVVHYFHPAGSCKMGPSGDAGAVVDPRGQVHGLPGVYVADASIMPTVPRANTNVPAAVIGERVAAGLIATP